MNHMASDTAAALLESVAATRRPKDIVVFMIGLLLGVAVMGLGVYLLMSAHGMFARFFGYSAVLAGLAVMFIAYVAVAARFTDEACGRDARSVGSALIHAVIIAPKALLVMLLYWLLIFVSYLPVGLLTVLFKIPAIGQMLALVLFPVMATLMGVLLYALLTMAAPLSVCALTQGRSVFATVAFVWASVRARLLDVILKSLIVALIAFVVQSVLSAIALMGIVTIGAVYGSALIESGMGMGMGMQSLLASVGKAWGVIGGAMLLIGLVCATSILVFVKGWSLIYADLDRQIDPHKEEKLLRAGYAQASKVAGDLQATAREQAEKMRKAAEEQAREMRERQQTDKRPEE